ncbi:MAG: plasmid maintenance system killer protein [Clostridia bacterium]|nr:plasmid maintenance system killer protein [Clostridia bacterium]
MLIEYSSNKLEKILNSPRLIKKHYGKNSNRLVIRLSELRAATSLSDIPDVPPPRRHKLTAEYDGCWGIDYSKNFRIILKPIGSFEIHDLSTIKEVMIIDLRDYH